MIVHMTLDDVFLTITARPIDTDKAGIIWIVSQVTASGGGDIYPILMRTPRNRKAVHRALDTAVADRRREWEGRDKPLDGIG